MRKYLVRFLPHLGCAFFFSMFINVLALAYILYLRLLFDKVMDSRSMETLFFLTAAVIGAYVISGILEVFRSKLLVRIGVKFDQIVAGRIFGSMLNQSVTAGGSKHTQGLKDLNSIRNFLGGTGIFALFDTPWVPVYLAVIFLFHPLLGYLACAGALILLLLVVVQEISTTRMQASHSQSAMNTEQFLNSSMRNAQTVYAMGMFPSMSRHWKQYNNQDIYYEDVLAARNGFFQSMAKFIMMGTVVVIMSTGAYLVIINEATLGTMVASAMFMSRALSPIMMLGNAWRSFVDARLAYKRLNELMAQEKLDTDPRTISGDSPQKPESCRADNVTLFLGQTPVFQDISFDLKPGEMLAITGPSGAGKTSLARVIMGIWKPDQGGIYLDDKPLDSFDQALLGCKMGYVPQEVELFSGTVAENIARLGQVDSPAVVDAAMQAQAHDMILSLPQGYDTRVGEGGVALSGGQKQRIVLARALYGVPWLLVMDEPDSHLDQTGREAIKEVLADLRKKELFVVVITHNQELIKMADRVLDLQHGKVFVGEGGSPDVKKLDD